MTTELYSPPDFKIYDAATDEIIPLTKERLEQFVASEYLLGQLLMALRKVKKDVVDEGREKAGLRHVVW